MFDTKSTIVQLYHGENQLIFNEMMTITLSCIFYSASSLIQQSKLRHIAPFGQIIPILNQPVFALFPERRSKKDQGLLFSQ
jgi:competence transcription factor ComK